MRRPVLIHRQPWIADQREILGCYPNYVAWVEFYPGIRTAPNLVYAEDTLLWFAHPATHPTWRAR